MLTQLRLPTVSGVLCGTFRIFLGFGNQLEELGAGHFAQHAGGHRIGLAVVVNVDVQPVHDVEVRIGKEFFHGRIAHLGAHATLHEGLKVGFRGQLTHILQRGQFGGSSKVLGMGCGVRCVSGFGDRSDCLWF